MKKNQSQNSVSRRKFLAMTGGTLGLAALTAAGIGASKAVGDEPLTPNLPTLDPSTLASVTTNADVLVVGSGIAGVFAAIKAHDAGAKVVMVSKGGVGTSGQTPFGRGLFAYDPKLEKLSIDEYVEAVSHSALGTNNPIFTRQTAEHSLARVKELEEWGFFKSNRYAEAFLPPLSERQILIRERTMLTHLVKEQGELVGAAGFSLEEGSICFFRAKSIVLCTGAGGFKPNGFPICDLTHDGSVMAYRIGAKITGKEWNDGHSGNLKNPADVYSQWAHNFESLPETTHVEIRHDLGVEQNYRTYVDGPQHMPPGHRRAQPMIAEGGPVRPSGFETPGPPPRPKKGGDEKMPPPGMRGAASGGASAGMSIHKSEGLVPYDETGQSNLPGLYAAGDALGSHMCGGIYTQIGSSMSGSAVQGAIAGEAAAQYSQEKAMPSLLKRTQDTIRNEILAPLKRKSGYSPAWVTQTLQGIMIPNFVLYLKKESLMTAALAYVEELRDHHVPMLKAADVHELRLAHETANMVMNAEMKLRASLLRKESRASHFRLDYPEMDTANWNAWINIFKDAKGKMVLEKQPFGQWPV